MCTIVVVAHDRHLLTATTDTFWLVDAGTVAPFDGDLDDYRDWVLARARRPTPGGGDSPGDRRLQKRAQAQARQQRYAQRKPLADKLARIEREMEALHERKREADAWLASEAAYADEHRDRLKATVAQQGDATWTLARLEAEWLELAEALQSLDAGGERVEE